MDTLMLSRIQFGLNITFHYLFPPMTIGLSWLLIIMEGVYMKTKKELYKNMVQFWIRIFALFFAMGVATGFVQVFAFGNNWSSFSKFVGDVFGTLLAAEGIFAFFLEAGFLGIMIFGWGHVRPWVHYLSTILVSVGATFSATWIVMANSWMQTPAGYKIIGEGIHKRAVIINLWDVYFNPSFLTRIGHVLLGCGLMGIFVIISISSYYFIRKKHIEFARFCLKLGLGCSIVALLLQLWSADQSAELVAKYQPTKLAAMEGLFETRDHVPLNIIGIVDMDNEKLYGIGIPNLLSLLIGGSSETKIKGLNEFPKENWPYVPIVFYSYKLMIYAWGAMMLYSLVGLFLWWRKKLEKARWYLWLAIFSIFFPYLGNTVGWFVAETGRQPWIVYNVMRTSEGLSKVVTHAQILGSLIMFICIFSLMLILFLFLLNRKVQQGPVDISQHKEGEYRDTFNY